MVEGTRADDVSISPPFHLVEFECGIDSSSASADRRCHHLLGASDPSDSSPNEFDLVRPRRAETTGPELEGTAPTSSISIPSSRRPLSTSVQASPFPHRTFSSASSAFLSSAVRSLMLSTERYMLVGSARSKHAVRAEFRRRRVSGMEERRRVPLFG